MNKWNIFKKVEYELNGFVHLFFGTIFIIIGIIALFVPIIPGIVIITAGLYIAGGHKLIKKIKSIFIKTK